MTIDPDRVPRLWLRAMLAVAAVTSFAPDSVVLADAPCRPGAMAMAKVELYMGVAGSTSAWRRFLAEEVTRRFPDGLTVLEGHGQWRGQRRLFREASRVLVIFYRPDATSDARIEAVRALYKRRFAQRSVLRVDSAACVSF